jgi:hypothetical protein
VEIFKKDPKYAITVIFIKIKTVYFTTYIYLLFLVALQSKAWVCSHLLAGIAGLNPTGAWMSFLLSVVVVRQRCYFLLKLVHLSG